MPLYPSRAANRDEAAHHLDRCLHPFEEHFDQEKILDDLHQLFGGWDFEFGEDDDDTRRQAFWGIVRKHDTTGPTGS